MAILDNNLAGAPRPTAIQPKRAVQDVDVAGQVVSLFVQGANAIGQSKERSKRAKLEQIEQEVAERDNGLEQGFLSGMKAIADRYAMDRSGSFTRERALRGISHLETKLIAASGGSLTSEMQETRDKFLNSELGVPLKEGNQREQIYRANLKAAQDAGKLHSNMNETQIQEAVKRNNRLRQRTALFEEEKAELDIRAARRADVQGVSEATNRMQEKKANDFLIENARDLTEDLSANIDDVVDRFTLNQTDAATALKQLDFLEAELAKTLSFEAPNSTKTVLENLSTPAQIVLKAARNAIIKPDELQAYRNQREITDLRIENIILSDPQAQVIKSLTRVFGDSLSPLVLQPLAKSSVEYFDKILEDESLANTVTTSEKLATFFKDFKRVAENAPDTKDKDDLVRKTNEGILKSTIKYGTSETDPKAFKHAVEYFSSNTFKDAVDRGLTSPEEMFTASQVIQENYINNVLPLFKRELLTNDTRLNNVPAAIIMPEIKGGRVVFVPAKSVEGSVEMQGATRRGGPSVSIDRREEQALLMKRYNQGSLSKVMTSMVRSTANLTGQSYEEVLEELVTEIYGVTPDDTTL